MPIERKHEVEADRYVVETLGGPYSAACQIELLLKTEQYTDVEQELMDQMRKDSWNNCDIVQLFRDGLYEDLPEERDERVIAHALKAVPNVFDEHPSFAQRLELAGCTRPMDYARFDADALTRLLNPNVALKSELNTYFHSIMDEPAREARERAQKSQQWLDENPSFIQSDDKELFLDGIKHLYNIGERAKYRTLLEERVAQYPDDVEYVALLALDRFKENPDESRVQLEKCIEQSPSLYMMNGTDVLLQYYIDFGDIDKIRAFMELRDGRMDVLQKEMKKSLSKDDLLEANILEDELRQTLSELFYDKYDAISRAYSVKRPFDSKTTYGVNFIVLERPAWYALYEPKLINELNEAFEQFTFIWYEKSLCERDIVPVAGVPFYDRKLWKKMLKERKQP